MFLGIFNTQKDYCIQKDYVSENWERWLQIVVTLQAIDSLYGWILKHFYFLFLKSAHIHSRIGFWSRHCDTRWGNKGARSKGCESIPLNNIKAILYTLKINCLSAYMEKTKYIFNLMPMSKYLVSSLCNYTQQKNGGFKLIL